jgi:hypothetical protein
MKTANLANEALRHAEVGHVYEEKLSGAMGTVKVLPMATFRVRAVGATTVTIDGILAMTMMAGEIAIFCAGKGDPNDTDPLVSIVIAGAAAFLQVARDTDRPKA